MAENGLVGIEVISRSTTVSIDMQALKRRYFIETELSRRRFCVS